MGGQVGQQIRELASPGRLCGDGLLAQDMPNDLDHLGRAGQTKVEVPKALEDSDGVGRRRPCPRSRSMSAVPTPEQAFDPGVNARLTLLHRQYPSLVGVVDSPDQVVLGVLGVGD